MCHARNQHHFVTPSIYFHYAPSQNLHFNAPFQVLFNVIDAIEYFIIARIISYITHIILITREYYLSGTFLPRECLIVLLQPLQPYTGDMYPQTPISEVHIDGYP